MVAEYHAGATALLAHFHLCNKGSYPFSAEAGERADILTNAGLTERQTKFIDLTRKFVNSRGEKCFHSPLPVPFSLIFPIIYPRRCKNQDTANTA